MLKEAGRAISAQLGCHDSDRAPNANYSVDALCSDTLAVIDQIGRPVILIGASMEYDVPVGGRLFLGIKN